MAKFQPIELPKPSAIAEQRCYDGDKWWSVPRLLLLAEQHDLPVMDIPLAGVCLPNIWPSDTLTFVATIQRVLACDLSHPILLDGDGSILDGRHRLARALYEGHPTIKAQRFPFMVNPDSE